MANYSAKVDVIISGIREAKALGDSLERVQGAIARISKTPIELNLGGRGGQRDLSGTLSKQVNDLVREFVNGERKLAKAVSGLNQQVAGFSELLSQTFIKGTGDISRQGNAVKNLANTWADANIELTDYTNRLDRLQRSALAQKGFMQLAGGQIARGVEDAGFGVQGPRLPGAIGGGMNLPPGVERLGPRALQGAQRTLGKPGVADAIIGAGFPALFGGGPGSIIGGGLGGLAGGLVGGGLGMALSIGLSAVGQKLDEASQKVKEVGDALNMLSVDKLRDSFIVVNAELETTVRRLLQAGQADAARVELAREVAIQTGALGAAIQDSGNATNMLGNAWNELSGSAAALLSMLAAPFAAALAGIVKILAMAVKGLNVIVSLVGGALKGAVSFIIGLLPGGKQLIEKIQQGVQGTNEETEKLKAELTAATDALHIQLMTAIKLRDIDKQRTHIVTTMGKLINIEAARQAKGVEIRAAAEEKINELRLKYSKLTDAASQRELALLIAQIRAQANLKVQEADRAAARERLSVLNQALVDNDKTAIKLANDRSSVESAVLQKKQAILATQIAELEQRRQLAMSFKEEAAIINSIADKKIKAAAEVYELAKLEQNQKIATAAAELESVKAAYERGFATEKQVRLAESNLNTTQRVAAETLAGAEATRDQAIAAANLEARMEKVAAFAKDAAAKTELFNQAAERSVNALNNNLKTVEAFSNAQTTINNLEIQSLQNKLAQAKTDAERVAIAQQIEALEISNARIALRSTQAQIKAEVERQRIAMAMAEVKYKELLSVVKYAEAQGAVKRELLQSLEAQKSALAIAQDNYRTSVQVANEQYRAAGAVYKAAVNAAQLKANLEGGAQAAAAIASSMDRGGGYLTASNIKNPILRAEAEGRLADVDRRTMSGGNPMLILKALDEKQQIVLNYMALEKKTAQEQQMQSAAQELRSLGLSRYIPMEYRTQEDKPALFQRYGASASSSGGSVNPQVSITTGPVMRMGDQNYVSQNDLMSATSSAARQGADMAISRLKNDSATRRSVGILR